MNLKSLCNHSGVPASKLKICSASCGLSLKLGVWLIDFFAIVTLMDNGLIDSDSSKTKVS